jgi:phage-related protein
MDLTFQSTTGAAVLKDQLGLAVGQLGKDMQSGGLLKAINDLHAHLQAAGITGAKVGAILGAAFTKKSSAPLAILLGELNQFRSKYPELAKGMNGFADAWKHTAATMAQQAADAKANIEAAFVGLGHMLAPAATAILHFFNNAFSWAKTHKKLLTDIAHELSPVLYGALIIVGGVLLEMAVSAALAAAPFIALAAAIGFGVKALVDLYNHNAGFHKFVDEVVQGFKKDVVGAVHWFMDAFKEAKRVVGEVIDAIVGFYHKHQAGINQMFNDIATVLHDIWNVFVSAFDAVKVVVQTAVKIIMDLWDRFGSHIWSHVVTAWHAIVEVVKGALEFLKGIFDTITGLLTGHWHKFWHGLSEIVGGAWHMIAGTVKYALNLISTMIGAAMAAISAAWDFVWHAIETFAVNVWHGIRDVGAAIIGWFLALPKNILRMLVGAGSWLYHVGVSIITGMLQGIGKAASWLWDWAKSLPGQLWNILGDVYHWMLSIGKDIVIGIWNGIAAAGSWLWDKLKNFGSSIVDGIKSFFGIGSPSKLMRDEVGKHLVTGIAQGILDNQHYVHNAMKKLADNTAKSRIHMGNFGLGVAVAARGHLATGHGAVGTGNTVYQINVQGSVIDSQGLFRAMQTASQQHGARNARGSGLAFTR